MKACHIVALVLPVAEATVCVLQVALRARFATTVTASQAAIGIRPAIYWPFALRTDSQGEACLVCWGRSTALHIMEMGEAVKGTPTAWSPWHVSNRTAKQGLPQDSTDCLDSLLHSPGLVCGACVRL